MLINEPVQHRHDLDLVFGALADPNRRAILERLGQGSATVTELAEPLPVSLPAVSRHLKVLEAAGLISRDRSAQWRPSSLRGEAVVEAITWMSGLTGVWDRRLDRLAAHLETRPQPTPAAAAARQELS